ncbi:MAG: pyruvate kinase, partial [Spirochaetota bacterium]
GMNIGRINTKYGDIEEFERVSKMLKELKCEILFDIKGLKYMDYLRGKKFDWLAVSYAETPGQINNIRKLFSRKIKIISKIETMKGINNLDKLLKVSDGIMVARGDLGNNIRLENVPIFQKKIIKKSNNENKFVITATEMLLSMVNSKSPERAEVSDIANAVLDGSDAVMLSEETALGKYPALVVKTMKRIIEATRRNARYLEN